jgi:hypothetical protein
MLKKIISGGQPGADPAGLVAIRHGIAHGGAIPKGRRTEAGALPEKYNLQEMDDRAFSKRTENGLQRRLHY